MPRKSTRVGRVCSWCGARFEITQAEAEKGRGSYCSRPCMAAGYAARPDWLRVWSKVEYGGRGCWEWTGYTNMAGYGVVTATGGRPLLATRVIWHLIHGEWPTMACHHCDNPRCCRPSHLYNGTSRSNTDDRILRGRTRFVTHHGEESHLAKLTADTVRAIRTRYAAGGISQDALAAEYGLIQAHVSRIIRRVAWAHVE